MALWNGLGQAATVAQLVGADAAGLVSAILQAVRTARRNRKECGLLARRVMMVDDLLQLLQDSETTRQPEVRRVLDGLGGALGRAYELVESCQEGSAVYWFIMAGRQAEQFSDVQSEIDSYLLYVFPVVSHIDNTRRLDDITRRLDRIYNILVPPDSQQVSEEVPGSPTIHLEPDARIQENTSEVIQLGNNQTITEFFEVGQHERAVQPHKPELESEESKLADMEATAVSVGKAVRVGKAVLDAVLDYDKSKVAGAIALQLGIARDVSFITDELVMMRSFLMIMANEERDQQHKVPTTWVKQVRDLAYNVEDSFMDFALQLEKESSWCIPRYPCHLRRIAKEVKELRAKVLDVSNWRI